MSVNVIERNGSNCRYVEICTHRVGSIGAPSRTVFIRGTNTKQWEVPKIAGRNTKTNIFQKESTGFETKVGLNKKKSTSGSCLRLRKDCRLDFSKAKVWKLTQIIIIMMTITEEVNSSVRQLQ
jgi:hypothetical protein